MTTDTPTLTPSTRWRGATRPTLGTLCTAVVLSIAPGTPATAAVTSPQCQLSADKTLRCTSGDGGPVLDFSFNVAIGGDAPATYAKAEQRGPQSLAIKTAPACDELNITAAADPSGGTRLAVSTRCTAPARICMNALASGPDLVLRPRIAYIQGRGATLGIQSDDRVGTEISPTERRLRFCTDPARLIDIGWSLTLFAGTPDDVQSAFQRIPAPILGPDGAVVGLSKTSPAVKDGYLFVDLTESNAGTLLPVVKRAGFPYVLIYGSTWAASLGSYDFNKKAYPNGLVGLRKVVQAANALGIKVGLHTLTSFVAKTDPLVPQAARIGLLKDDRSTLYTDIDASATRIVAADALNGFPDAQALYGDVKSGLDVLIDDEILSCPNIEKSAHGVLDGCKRGLYGTRPTAHRTGAPIQHLAERYGAYLADLRGPLKAQLAQRLGKVIDEAGIDMVYFDGGEVGTANGEPAWFVAEQQIAILKQVHRPLLVEGSGVVPRLWPYLTRIVDDDFATLATIDFLDQHKIGESRKGLQNMLMPDNLGWLGLLKENPAYPATTPEEIATYVARSLSLNTPLGIETLADALDRNPYTGRLLDVLALGNRSLKSNMLPAIDRTRLAQGMWYQDSRSPQALSPFRPIRFALDAPQPAGSLAAAATDQGIALRIRRILQRSPDARNNIVLTASTPASFKTLPAPATLDDKNRGLLAASLPLKSTGTGTGAALGSFIDFATNKPTGRQALDLSANRTLMVDFDYSANDAAAAPVGCAIANLQLQDNRGQYRDYLLNLAPGTGQRAVLDYERGAGAILRDLKPAPSAYAIKPALYGFDFTRVARLNVRWMRTCSRDATLRINTITMLAEQPTSLSRIALKVGNTHYAIADTLTTGETVDVYPDGTVSRCKESNCNTTRVPWPTGRAVAGQPIQLQATGDATAEVTLGLIGAPLRVER